MTDGRGDGFRSAEPHPDLKGSAIRGGVVTVSSQFAQFFVHAIATVVLARLLSPQDYGTVGMVTAVTGVLTLLVGPGLPMATLQRENVTRELISTVFWINVALALALTLLSNVLAVALASFYGEPQLYWITLAVAASFLIDAAGAQHFALLRRQMRLRAVAMIDMTSATIGVSLSIVMAVAGFGYWSLVAMRIASTLTGTMLVWMIERWRPGLPRRGAGAGSMIRFGSFLTGVELVNYLFRNVDNVLIGWFWGASSLGLYQKAYSLLMLPIHQVNAPITAVAVATLSRVQSDPERQRRYFVAAYSMASSIILPIVVAAAIFANDIIRLVLGEQWSAAASIFRLLVPAALIGALLNPLGWLFVSSGRAERQLKAGLVWSALIILAFCIGVRYGPEGVAVGFSAMSTLLAVPLCLYAIKDTAVRVKDLAQALKYPAIAATVAGLSCIFLELSIPNGTPTAVRAIGGCFAVVSIYAFFLLIILRQLAPYRELIKHVLPGRNSGMAGNNG
jgi:O-antigen/teichoic acid export membrane protein